MPQPILTLRLLIAALGGFLLFASLIALPFAGLPLAYIGLSFGLAQAMITAALTVSLTAIFLTPSVAVTFGVVILLPILFLIRQALLSRRIHSDDDTDDIYEFYPLHRLILWGLGITAAATILLYLGAAGQEGGLPELFLKTIWEAPEIRDALQQVYNLSERNEIKAIANLMLVAGIASWPLIVLGNLQLGQALAVYSKRNLRPAPNYEHLRLPDRLAVVLLVCMLGGLLTDGWLSHLLTVLTSICMVAYFLLGLAIIHAISRDWNARGFILAGLYFLLLVSAWVIIPVSLLGLLDTRLNFRHLPDSGEMPPDKKPPNKKPPNKNENEE